MEKFQIFDQNHRLTLLEISRFFNFLDFLILEPKNTFFLSRTSSNTFSCLILPIVKQMDNFQIFDQNHGLITPLEKSLLLDFVNFFILEPKNDIFLSRIIVIKHILLADFAINKNILLADFAINKKMKKCQIIDQNHGLTSLDNYQIFDFFSFVIL